MILNQQDEVIPVIATPQVGPKYQQEFQSLVVTKLA